MSITVPYLHRSRDVYGDRETREVRSVHRRPYARLTDGRVREAYAMVRHRGHLARRAVDARTALFGRLDERIV